MSGFAARIFAPKGQVTKPAPFPEQARATLALTIKGELLKPQYNPAQILLETKGAEPLVVSVDKIRDTAAVATWIRKTTVADGKVVTGQLHAVSVMLTGLDKAADDEAIGWVEYRTDQKGNRLRHAGPFATAARNESRPIVMALCQSYEISIDPLFVASVEMVAQAFFDQFGVEGDKKKFDAQSGGY